ncbi:MAG: ABC transporter permease [Gemmatimonadetes bacterium]|nr:ABC transporter permease [Gemmatimonadota bacterium]NNK64012.1 ABC transporter permease subunit [Gemmatimonadota bacterium]
MTAFVAVVRVTLLQLLGRKKLLGFGLLSLIPAALLFFAARARVGPGLDTDLGAMVVSPFFSIVLPVTALILGGAALGDERRDKTLSFLVLRPMGRLTIVVAKTVAAIGASLLFAVIGTLGLALVYAVGGGGLNVIPSVLAGATVLVVAYASIFTLLGNVTTRPTVVGLLYIVFVENAFVQELPRLAPISPWRMGLAATLDLMPDDYPARALLGGIGELVPSWTNAMLATVGIVVVSIAIGTVLLRRRDAV